MEAIKSCSTELHVSSMVKTFIHLTITINEYSNTLFIQARSEQGSRRLPRERSSEISKNCHKNYLYKHPNIHVRGNKSGRQIWAFFVAFSCDLQNDFQIYIRMEINQAGKFGPFLLDFRTLSKMTSKHTMT